jgi:hypothetical protein
MSSLIYVTRIQPPSPAVTRALESSGFHVKCFGPGEITADECILVMTSEAALAGVQIMKMASGSTMGAQFPAAPSLQDMQKHLGVDAAIWNCIRAAESGASALAEPAKLSNPAASISASIPATENLGFVASQAGTRALTASQKTTPSPLLLPEPENAPAENQQSSVPDLSLPWLQKQITQVERKSILLWKRVTSPEIRSSSSSRHSRFWQPAYLAATVLLVAIVLLAGRASLFPSPWAVAPADNGNSGSRSDSRISELIRKTSGAETANRLSNPADSRRHLSDDNFVAEDHTTHFDSQSRPVAAPSGQASRSVAQKPPVRKRVVFN